MDNVWCVAEDGVAMPLADRKELAIIALAEQHPEVIVFRAELTTDGFFASELKPVEE